MFGPGLGSEAGNTWGWAWALCRHVPVTVVAHPQFRERVENHLRESVPPGQLNVHWVEVPRLVDPWRPSRGERGIRLHYLLWLRRAVKVVREISAADKKILVHLVSWGTVSAPPPPLGRPVVWGPVGGGQIAPAAFRAYFGETWRFEQLRSLRVRLLPHLPCWRHAVQSADVALATNRETETLLRRGGARDVRLWLDCGLPSAFVEKVERRRMGGGLRLLWAGRLEPHKGLPLALEALAQVPDNSVTLEVAGAGSMQREWREMVQRLGLSSRVRFLGWIPHPKMPELFRRADAFIFTSLRDSFGSQVLEAMGFGLPILTLDHQGVGWFVPKEAGVKVPVSTPAETIRKLAEGIRILQDPKVRLMMSRAAHRFAQQQTWDRRAEAMLSLYEEILARRS